jgi:hypothetical protein
LDGPPRLTNVNFESPFRQDREIKSVGNRTQELTPDGLCLPNPGSVSTNHKPATPVSNASLMINAVTPLPAEPREGAPETYPFGL